MVGIISTSTIHTNSAKPTILTYFRINRIRCFFVRWTRCLYSCLFLFLFLRLSRYSLNWVGQFSICYLFDWFISLFYILFLYWAFLIYLWIRENILMWLYSLYVQLFICAFYKKYLCLLSVILCNNYNLFLNCYPYK